MKAVDETLRPLPGVTDVEINFASRTAWCSVDPEKFDADDAVAKLQKRYPDAALKN